MSESTLQASVLDALGDGVYFLDTTRRIQVWNQGATAITGYSAERVLGQACADGLLNHVDEEGRALCGTLCPLRATMIDGQERQARMYLHHEDGRLIPVLVRARAVRDPSGAVVGAVESFRDDTDYTATTRRVAELETLAMLDPLTGVGNRRYMDAVLRDSFEEHRRTGGSFAALLLDLDHFKDVNDTFGHDMGDAVLRAVATLLTSAVRRDEAVVRFGGEEFLVITRAMTQAEGIALARRLNRLVGQIWHRAADQRFTVTVSIGVTMMRSDDTADSILHRADQALLQAKRSGRNRVSVG
jgi:diguanylate cyclase (GGDEF)-like protein/PAS domain S-box-containing protein